MYMQREMYTYIHVTRICPLYYALEYFWGKNHRFSSEAISEDIYTNNTRDNARGFPYIYIIRRFVGIPLEQMGILNSRTNLCYALYCWNCFMGFPWRHQGLHIGSTSPGPPHWIEVTMVSLFDRRHQGLPIGSTSPGSPHWLDVTMVSLFDRRHQGLPIGSTSPGSPHWLDVTMVSLFDRRHQGLSIGSTSPGSPHWIDVTRVSPLDRRHQILHIGSTSPGSPHWIDFCWSKFQTFVEVDFESSWELSIFMELMLNGRCSWKTFPAGNEDGSLAAQSSWGGWSFDRKWSSIMSNP